MPSGAENPTGPGSLRARLAAAGVDLPPDAAELERALTLHAARLRDLEAAADLGPDDPPFPAQPGWARPGWVQPGRTSDPPIAGAPGSPEPSDPGRPRPGGPGHPGPGGPGHPWPDGPGRPWPGGPGAGRLPGPGALGPEPRTALAPGVRWGRGRSGGGPAGQAVPGLVDAAALVRDGELTSVALVERVLGRIEAEDGRLGAFVAVLASRALDEAAMLDAERARGRLRGPLHGVPVAVKDLLDVAGTVTGAGSPKLAANLAAADAEAVARLRRAGAVVVGKTRTHEFAYGVRTPGTVNPWDPERIAGGSSGGSAAAVAAGLVPAAVGSDTAGSIRIPAACCGVVGLKPTYGAVPVTGVWPLAWSCDTVGPIAGSVADAALAFAVLAGRALPAPEPEPGPEPAGLRLGWLVGEEVEAIDPGVASVMGELRARLAAAGVVVDEVRLPLRAARAAVGAIVLPELAAAHARLLAETGEEGYGPPVLAAIRLGQAALAGEYLAGLRYRGRFAALVEQALAGRDALVLPTVPVPAPRHHDSTVLLGGVPVGVQAALTALPGSFNCSGSPVLSLPAGVSGGLPVGISLVGRAGGDGQLLRFAAALEPVLPAPGRPPTSA